MIFLSIITSILIIFFLYHFLRHVRFDGIIILALALKIIAGIGLGLIYKLHYNGGDTFQYFAEAKTLALHLLDHPAKFFNIYFFTDTLLELSDGLVFDDQPRALFFSKIISVFYLLSGGNYWLTSVFLSFFNFLCIFYLLKQLVSTFPYLEKASYASFYFLPTFVFWTSGLLKESLAIGALSIAAAVVIKFSRTNKYNSVRDWFVLVISLLLLWYLKYYYAAVAAPCLGLLLIYDVLKISQKYRFYLALGFGVIAAIIISNLHYNLSINRMLEIIYQNYRTSSNLSDTLSIRYYQFDGSISAFLLNIPIALYGGLFRPAIIETESLFQHIVAVENSLVFIILIVALWRSKLKIDWQNHYLKTTLLYVIILAIFIAFAAPNFGTLSRYKVAYWPFFVLLVSALIFNHKKRPGFRYPDPT